MSKSIYSEEHKFAAERLKNARHEVRLSQSEVAKLLGMTQSHVSKVESGQRRIDIVALKKLACIYKKPLEFFVKE